MFVHHFVQLLTSLIKSFYSIELIATSVELNSTLSLSLSLSLSPFTSLSNWADIINIHAIVYIPILLEREPRLVEDNTIAQPATCNSIKFENVERLTLNVKEKGEIEQRVVA